MWFAGVLKMQLVLLMLVSFMVGGGDAKVVKKKQSSGDLKQVTKKIPQNAVIAIEIVDANDNSTKGNGRKRTIDSSLGYGYQNFFSVQQKPPKYEVYKYSQHDIPAYKGSHEPVLAPPPINQHHYQEPEFEIQKSVRYDLGTRKEFIPHQPAVSLNHYYQPGTTYFSTLDHGHVGGLTQQPPQQLGKGMVPVIVLRVFTNQLTQPGALHANIPQSHPYAGINNIDLQSLLAGYVRNHQEPQRLVYQQPQQHQHSVHAEQDDGLQTHENYPDDAHTKVIFHKTPVKQSNVKTVAITPKAPTQKFKITVPANTFSKVQIQEHTYQQEQPQQQLYYYPTAQDYSDQQQPEPHYYDQQQQQYYEPPQQQQQQYYVTPQAPQQQQQHYNPQESQDYYYPDASQDQQQQQPVYYIQKQQHGYEQQTQQQYILQPQPTYYQEHVTQQAAVTAGRDLHPKIYNHHAQEAAHKQKSTRSSSKKRRVTRVSVISKGEKYKV